MPESDEVGEVVFKCTFGDARAGKREIFKAVDGILDIEEPFCRRGDVSLRGDDVVDFIELFERGGRPDDVHIP